MSELKAKKLENGNYKIQVGDVWTTFHLSDEGKVTVLAKDGSIKDFHFEDSSIQMLIKIAGLLYQVAKESKKLAAPDEEIEVRGNKYRLVK